MASPIPGAAVKAMATPAANPGSARAPLRTPDATCYYGAMTNSDSLGSAGTTAPLLELREMRVFRGEKIALDNINLRIDAREHVAILGPNGCGKSTLIKTITRELYPAAREGSSMTILGRSRWNIFELRNLLGIVSNDLMLSVYWLGHRPGCGRLGVFQRGARVSASPHG